MFDHLHGLSRNAAFHLLSLVKKHAGQRIASTVCTASYDPAFQTITLGFNDGSSRVTASLDDGVLTVAEVEGHKTASIEALARAKGKRARYHVRKATDVKLLGRTGARGENLIIKAGDCLYSYEVTPRDFGAKATPQAVERVFASYLKSSGQRALDWINSKASDLSITKISQEDRKAVLEAAFKSASVFGDPESATPKNDSGEGVSVPTEETGNPSSDGGSQPIEDPTGGQKASDDHEANPNFFGPRRKKRSSEMGEIGRAHV